MVCVRSEKPLQRWWETRIFVICFASRQQAPRCSEPTLVPAAAPWILACGIVLAKHALVTATRIKVHTVTVRSQYLYQVRRVWREVHVRDAVANGPSSAHIAIARSPHRALASEH